MLYLPSSIKLNQFIRQWCNLYYKAGPVLQKGGTVSQARPGITKQGKSYDKVEWQKVGYQFVTLATAYRSLARSLHFETSLELVIKNASLQNMILIELHSLYLLSLALSYLLKFLPYRNHSVELESSHLIDFYSIATLILRWFNVCTLFPISED